MLSSFILLLYIQLKIIKLDFFLKFYVLVYELDDIVKYECLSNLYTFYFIYKLEKNGEIYFKIVAINGCYWYD